MSNFAYLKVTPITVRRNFILKLANVTCGGESVFSYLPCLEDGIICNDHGTCLNGACVCQDGWGGTRSKDAQSHYLTYIYFPNFSLIEIGTTCQYIVVNSTSSGDNTAAIAAGIAVPVGIIVLCCLVLAWLVTIFVLKRSRGKSTNNQDWVIPYTELEMGDVIAIGGYGEVRKAEWKGSAVSVLA